MFMDHANPRLVSLVEKRKCPQWVESGHAASEPLSEGYLEARCYHPRNSHVAASRRSPPEPEEVQRYGDFMHNQQSENDGLPSPSEH